MSTYVVTGTSRGIGLELVKQLLQLPESQVAKIFAITRSTSSDALKDLLDNSNGRAQNITIKDFTDERTVRDGIAEIEKVVQGKGIDVLVNNAGTNQPFTPGGIKTLTGAQLLEGVNANVVSAHLITAAALPLLQQGQEKKIVNVSTTVGSMAYARDFAIVPAYAYKISKAAMNMMTVQYALDLEKDGFTVFAVSPGWLKTDLGGKDYAHLEPSTGVEQVMEMILKADKSFNGKFLNVKVDGWEGIYDGGELLF